jgi:hypothetical protein
MIPEQAMQAAQQAAQQAAHGQNPQGDEQHGRGGMYL